MRAIEAALLIGVFFLLRTAIKRVPPRYFVLVEALIFLRLLLPSFPLLPFNVWGSIEMNENAKMILSTHLFEKISPFVAATLLLWGFLSYLLLLRKRSYQSGKNNLYYHDGKEAFVVGFFRPTIFLPFEEDKRKKELLLLHEQIHIRRGDPQLLLFGYLVLCLNWYNPLVWILFFRMRQDMDLACDDAVLHTGVDPKEYAKLLVEQAASKPLLMLGMRWYSVKDRVKQMKRRTVSRGFGLVLFVIMLTVLLPFVSGRQVLFSEKSGVEPSIQSSVEQDVEKVTVYYSVKNEEVRWRNKDPIDLSLSKPIEKNDFTIVVSTGGPSGEGVVYSELKGATLEEIQKNAEEKQISIEILDSEKKAP